MISIAIQASTGTLLPLCITAAIKLFSEALTEWVNYYITNITQNMLQLHIMYNIILIDGEKLTN